MELGCAIVWEGTPGAEAEVGDDDDVSSTVRLETREETVHGHSGICRFASVSLHLVGDTLF